MRPYLVPCFNKLIIPQSNKNGQAFVQKSVALKVNKGQTCDCTISKNAIHEE